MTTSEPPTGSAPATAAWREGDPVAAREFVDVGPLTCELGGELPNVRVAYETFGTPRFNDEGRIENAVLVLHALSGDAHVSGPASPGQLTAGWWADVVGSGLALDTDVWFAVCPNVLGGCGGTTGPSSIAPDGKEWGSRFPRTTIRDQVAVEVKLADALQIDHWAAVLGGSMGGMRALEWTVGYPERVGASLVLAVGASATADEIGLYRTQLLAITGDPGWRGGDYYDAADGEGPHVGLGLARRIAHLSYRSEHELQTRFGRAAQGDEDPLRGGRFAIESYLDHHADKLVRRFDAGTYVALTEAMNTHDVGRGRGGELAALQSISVPVVVAGVDSDRLYPLHLQARMAEAIPTCDELIVIRSDYGHDGFLIESDAVGAAVRKTLALSRVPAITH